MDWKYKHFQQERVYAESREVVVEAARSFMAESLGWQVTETPDGLTAQGDSFTHRAIANIHIQSIAEGTKITVELLVERASMFGFMLVDVGGYYSIQIRKWLDGIQWTLNQKLTGSVDQSTNPLVIAAHKPSAHIFNGCLVFIIVMFALYLLVTLISAAVGVITGNLYLFGRGGTVAVHGIAARILAAVILIVGVFLGLRIMRAGRPRSS